MWTTQDVPGVGAYVYRVRPTQNLSEGKTEPQAMELGATLDGVCLLSEEMGKKSYG